MRAHLAVVALCTALAAAAQDRSLNPALHLAFVGELQGDRGKDFLQFLRAQFGRVDAIDRSSCTTAQLRTADVVVLDWPQQQGVIEWMKDKQTPHQNPLGELRRWDRPTVLLGSAGLNVAADWGLPGAYG